MPPNNNPKVIQPNQEPVYTHSKRLLLNRRAELAVVLVIIILVIGLGLYYSHHTKKKPQILPMLSQTYKTTTKYSVKGQVAGTGLSFDKPSEFGNVNSSQVVGIGSMEEDTTNGKNQTSPLAEAAATTTPLSAPFAAESLKSINTTILGPQVIAHRLLMGGQQFVAQNADSGYTVKLGAAKAYKTSNVSSNAWQIALTATPTKASDADRLPNQQGELIYAISSKAFYYFFVMSASYNWTNNQTSWQKVLNSLQIDQ